MEYSIKFFPKNYTDIAYYADCAGLNEISTEYTFKAFEDDPCAESAYNLALEYDIESEYFWDDLNNGKLIQVRFYPI